MFKTTPLRVPRVLPPFHQPLPLNRREAQRLLDTLTTSFRKHLDREHGWLPDEGPSHGQPLSAHRRPTDHHLSTILSNPIFNPPPVDGTHKNAGSARTKQGVASISKQTDVFDRAVAGGMMSKTRAHGFLISVRDGIRRSSVMSVQDGMRASGAGLRVANWIRSSGMEENMAFVSNVNFMRLLVQFMLAEGLEDRVWLWLQRLRDMGPSAPRWTYLLGSLVRAKTMDGPTLDAAYASILRGEEMFKDRPHASTLLHPWFILFWQSTVRAWRYSPGSEDLFENYVAISDHLRRPLPLERAHLDLHHPNPDKVTPDRAVRLLTEQAPARGWEELFSSHPGGLRQGVTQVMALGLDTVKYLSQAGDTALAQRILGILQRDIEPLYPSSDKGFKLAY